MDRWKRIQQLFIVFIGLGLLVSGCAGAYSTLPGEKISKGDKAILEAKESNASLNAPVELKAAEDKLAEFLEKHPERNVLRGSYR
jgi:hypothetical protein